MRGSPFDVNIMMAGGGGSGPQRRTCVRCEAKMQQHEGLCGRCWKKERKAREKRRKAGDLERRLQEEQERARKKGEEIRQLAEASFAQAVAEAAERVKAEDTIGTMDEICAKCGVRPAVAEYELEENEQWDEVDRKKAWLCTECAREVSGDVQGKYDNEDGHDGSEPDESACKEHGVPGHDDDEPGDDEEEG